MVAPLVLLTGAAGFTGRYVKAALVAAGYRVHGWGAGADESVDITDRQAVADAVQRIAPDYVVHLAAIAFVAHGDVGAIYEVNVVGTRYLLEALSALPRGPRKVLLASSANVYGDRPGAIVEDTPFHPQNDYAVSKVAMEYMARVWAARLPILVVRPFNYTGVGQDEQYLLPKIVAHFRRGESVIELGNIDVWRDFNDVRAVADIYVRLLNAETRDEVYNVCSGQEISIREIISVASELSGREIEVRVNRAFVRSNEVVRLHGDRSRLEALLGPLPDYDIRNTVRWMLEA